MARTSRFAFASSGDEDEKELLTLSAWSSDDELWLRDVLLHPVASISTIPPRQSDHADNSCGIPDIMRDARIWTNQLVPVGFNLAQDPPNLAETNAEVCLRRLCKRTGLQFIANEAMKKFIESNILDVQQGGKESVMHPAKGPSFIDERANL